MKRPAPTDCRHEPLPTQRQKPGSEDPQAPSRVRTILDSPSYRQADRDLDFLQRGDMRGLRLMLDYLKPQTLLTEQNVAHTIVVFGGTRIPEAKAARRIVASAARAVEECPGDDLLRQRLRIAKRVLAKSKYYEVAREFGRLVGHCGNLAIGGRIMVMTGGGPGIMEAANRGACDVGAQSIGLNITLPQEEYPNPYITPELCYSFYYFATRKFHFALRARALVAFPGGYGTLEELFEILTLAQNRILPPVPVVLVGEEYWRGVFNVDFLVEEGTIAPEDRDLFWYAETAEEIWHDILAWYELKGEPLLPPGAEAFCFPS